MKIRHLSVNIFFIVLINFIIAQYVFAMEHFDFITTDELKTLLEKREKKETDFILVNTLNEIIHNHHHIPGSINLPPDKVFQNIHIIGENKEKLIITY